jgi:phosphatidate cytidylyltransferase
MKLEPDDQTYWLVGGGLAMLAIASIAGPMLAHTARIEEERVTARNLNARIRAWWFMAGAASLAMTIGEIGAIILFALVSLLALREFITLTPTRQGDYHTLFWVFFVLLPLQYVLIGAKRYGLGTIVIPVYAFLFIPWRSAMAGDGEHFLERTAKIQWGLMLCVYGLSYIPALLGLDLSRYRGQNGKLLIFFVLVVELTDVFQSVGNRFLGRRKIAPNVSHNKTLEGFAVGISGAVMIGAGLWWATPFTPPQAAGISLAVALAGYAGGLVMTAIKRGLELNVCSIIIDRIAPLCFAAPVFFHLTWHYFT